MASLRYSRGGPRPTRATLTTKQSKRIDMPAQKIVTHARAKPIDIYRRRKGGDGIALITSKKGKPGLAVGNGTGGFKAASLPFRFMRRVFRQTEEIGQVAICRRRECASGRAAMRAQ